MIDAEKFEAIETSAWANGARRDLHAMRVGLGEKYGEPLGTDLWTAAVAGYVAARLARFPHPAHRQVVEACLLTAALVELVLSRARPTIRTEHRRDLENLRAVFMRHSAEQFFSPLGNV